MNKKVLSIIIGLAVGLTFFVPSNTYATTKKPKVVKPVQKDYDYELVDQQPSAPFTMRPGEVKTVWVEVKNTGTKIWNPHGPDSESWRVKLGTGSKYDYKQWRYSEGSQFYYAGDPCEGFTDPKECSYNSWPSHNRATPTSPIDIRPGWNTRFQFKIQAPITPGTYKEYFTPVADGITWMKDVGIYWEIKVVNNRFDLLNGETIKVNYGDSISVDTLMSNTSQFNYDNNILNIISGNIYCDNPAPNGVDPTMGIPYYCPADRVMKQSTAIQVVGSGFTRIEKGDFSANIVSGRDYYSYYSSSISPLRVLTNAKKGEIVIVRIPVPQSDYMFAYPEFPTEKIRLVDHNRIDPILPFIDPISSYASDQWVFEILDANGSSYIQISASQPWAGGNSFTDFLLNINPDLPCASGTTGCSS